MQKSVIAQILGVLALASVLAATAFDAIFAFSMNQAKAWIQLLAFVAFAVNVLVIATLVFLNTYYVAKLKPDPIGLRPRLFWRFLILGIVVTVVSMPLSLITLIGFTNGRRHLPSLLLNEPTENLLIAWFALWGMSGLLRIAFFVFIAIWTKKAVKKQAADQQSLDLDFGIGSTDMVEARPETRDRTSFQSQDVTLASPPRTPTTHGQKSPRWSSTSTRVGPGSSRTKLVPNSAKSSFDSPAFPAAEAIAMDNAFDRWDTSGVHQEVRATLQSSSPVPRSGLETIPGSRPESPANALDGPFLPSSPIAISSDTATAVDWIPSSSRKVSLSSPPSSPPNFSRPTSSNRNKATLQVQPSMEDLVHPLFRSTSPNPAPIAASGTMITASPMAGQPITPRTLYRLRSGTFPPPSRTNLLADVEGSGGSTSGSPGPGSPGPSIVEEEELPPILPGFVLSAGQRTSLVGYGKRKSVKESNRAGQNHPRGPGPVGNISGKDIRPVLYDRTNTEYQTATTHF